MTHTVTMSRMITCVERELVMRNGAYRHMVHKKRMTQDYADEEIAAMTAVLSVLKMLSAQGVP